MPGRSDITATVNFRLPHAYIADLNRLAKRRGVDRSTLIRQALESQLGSELAEIIVSEPNKVSATRS
ncbi:ribbon-helix-helix protein, CopG family [Leptolyngbya sp. FACHB-541]|uniref:ribbon-helix-helix domain-containing protein n=1 Tax=Leptolyngbya sp. FACHB-541 TaxID=2692810 RepID=UPI0016857810|nr:CopG family transcriptional regulator [Leptolyngbya sp. FACHB-541]MBD1995081.1 ribbon-helix-helix protein, CopG family [Leptolyngbya sp. FACHB-541]